MNKIILHNYNKALETIQSLIIEHKKVIKENEKLTRLNLEYRSVFDELVSSDILSLSELRKIFRGIKK